MFFWEPVGKWHSTKYIVGAPSLLFERNLSTLDVGVVGDVIMDPWGGHL